MGKQSSKEGSTVGEIAKETAPYSYRIKTKDGLKHKHADQLRPCILSHHRSVCTGSHMLQDSELYNDVKENLAQSSNIY